MVRVSVQLVVIIAILTYATIATPCVSAHNVLVLSSGSTELDRQAKAGLENQGHLVTVGPQFVQFSGQGLAGQNVVLLLATLDPGDGDMPSAGQNALLNFVSAGGGLVTSEWTTWMSAFRSFRTLSTILPVVPTSSYSEANPVTYAPATPDRVLNRGIPAALTFVADFSYGTETVFAPRPGATVFYTSKGAAGGAGVVGWRIGSGGVIQFSTLLGVKQFGDPVFSQLVANAVAWSATIAQPIVTQVKIEPATVQVGGSLAATFSGMNFGDGDYLDIRFRGPGSAVDEVVLNWQHGISGTHAIASGTAAGVWTVTGVRAHQNQDEHAGDFDSVSAAVTVVLSTCFVTTPSGAIQGIDLGSTCAFLGIPYAAPPVGALRWKAPQSNTPWTPAVLFATTAPPNCAAISLSTGLPAGVEDCLRLNIWIPKRMPAAAAPVFVWIHAGGFVASSANFAGHNGQKLAEQQGVVVVAPNYRLGPFGFLAHSALTNESPGYGSSGNYGLLDQRAALVWVKENIGGFGGDSNNVTIAGQSAGAHSVSLHLVSPRSSELFQRALMESGYASTRWKTREEAELQGNTFAAALGCTDTSQILTCMRSKSREQVLVALTAAREEFVETGGVGWSPVVDGIEVPDQPRILYERGQFNRVPILLGANKDEGWTFVDRSFPDGLTASRYQTAIETEFAADAPAFLAHYRVQDFASPKEALAQLTGDAEYACEAVRVSELIARTGTPVYLYSFEYVVDGLASNHVVHGVESNLVFGNNFAAPNPGNHLLSSADLAVSQLLGGYWARFAAKGDPNATDKTAAPWPMFQQSIFGTGRYLVLNSVTREARGLREQQCDFLKPVFFRSITGPVPASRP